MTSHIETYADALCDTDETNVLGGFFPEWSQPLTVAAVRGSSSFYGDFYMPRCRRVVVSCGQMNPRCGTVGK